MASLYIEQDAGAWWSQPVRGIRRKVIDVPPSKPPKFEYSGDLQKALPPVDPAIPRPGYELAVDMLSENPEVAKLYTMEFATGQEVLKRRLDDMLERVKDHPADVQSLEYKIARYTVLIRNQLQHMQVNGHFKDKRTKRLLVQRIQARRKFLKWLQTRDIEKFNWLLKELKIKFIPATTTKKETKREKRIRLAEEEAERLTEAKIKAVKERFQEEKAKFLVEKEEALKEIQEDLEMLGIQDDMTSIDGLIKKLGVAEFMPPEKATKSRRQQVMAKKFELYKGRKKGKYVNSSG